MAVKTLTPFFMNFRELIIVIIFSDRPVGCPLPVDKLHYPHKYRGTQKDRHPVEIPDRRLKPENFKCNEGAASSTEEENKR